MPDYCNNRDDNLAVYTSRSKEKRSISATKISREMEKSRKENVVTEAKEMRKKGGGCFPGARVEYSLARFIRVSEFRNKRGAKKK